MEKAASAYLLRNTQFSSKLPISIEREHKDMLVLLTDIGTRSKSFRISNLDNFAVQNGKDYMECRETVNDIMCNWGLSSVTLRNWEEFVRMTKDRKVERNIRKRKSYENAMRICNRAKLFEDVSEKIHGELSECVHSRLMRYCQSFHRQLHANMLGSVAQYQDKIERFSRDLRVFLLDIGDSLASYSSIKLNGIQFFEDGVQSEEIMKEFFRLVNETSDIIREWIDADKLYVKELWEEIVFGNLQKERLKQELTDIRKKQQNLEQILQRKLTCLKHFEDKLDRHRKERRKLKRSKETVDYQIDKTKEEIEKKSTEVELTGLDMLARSQSGVPYSPMQCTGLLANVEILRCEVSRLEERLMSLGRQTNRLEKEYAHVQEIIQSTEQDVESFRAVVDRLKHKLTDAEVEIKRSKTELDRKGVKVATAKKIRELKLSPGTLRRIYFNRFGEPGKSTLDEACKIVSTHLGKDWKILYEVLPFVPPRDSKQRHLDIEAIDPFASVREQVNESLEKWRVFNKNSSVTQLLAALARVQRTELAQMIEKEFRSLIIG